MGKGFGKEQLKDVWDAAQQAAILSDGEIATGIVQHPVTKRWQTWVSLHGTDIACFTAHNDRAAADRVARDIAETWKSGRLQTQDEVTAYLHSLPSDTMVDPLPQKVVMRLGKLIKG